MKLPAYMSIIISIGISGLQAFVASTKLTKQQKTDINLAITAGQKVLTDFGA